MERHVEYGLNRATNWARRTGMKIAGVGVRQILGVVAGVVAAAVGAVGVGMFAPAVMSVGAGILIAGWLNKKDHDFRKGDMATLYRREIASIKGMHFGEVTAEDLEDVAKQNATLGQAIEASDKRRKGDTIIWAVAAIAGAAAALAIGGIPFIAAAGFAKAFYSGVVGFAVFRMAESVATPLVKGDRKPPPTVADKVRALEMKQFAGKALAGEITQEEVMSVFVTAKPELAKAIHEQFNKPFDALSPGEKLSATLQYGRQYDVEAITQAININEYNAQELAFTVCGQRSGASPDPTVTQRLYNGVSKAKEHIGNLKDKGHQAFQGFVGRFKGRGEQAPEYEQTPPQEAGGYRQRIEAEGRRAVKSSDQGWEEHITQRGRMGAPQFSYAK